jgi:hypothetical protein
MRVDLDGASSPVAGGPSSIGRDFLREREARGSVRHGAIFVREKIYEKHR